MLDELELDVFRDERSIGWGDSLQEEVRGGIDRADVLLMIASPASLKSPWVHFEVGYASALGKTILPYLTHPSLELPETIRGLKYCTTIGEVRGHFQRIALGAGGAKTPLGTSSVWIRHESPRAATSTALPVIGDDRELVSSPLLRLAQSDDGHPEVENIGRGSALNCRLAHAEFSGDPPRWCSFSTELFSLSPGEKSGPLLPATGSRWHDSILRDLMPLASSSIDGVTACVCEDQLGNRRRFVAGQLLQGSAGPLRSGSPPPDVWQPGDAEPSWIHWYMATSAS